MNRIDFMGIIVVQDANPNGDPLNGNRPRQTFEGFGEMSAECLKRKIRNALQRDGHKIFVQSNDFSDDGLTSLAKRQETTPGYKASLRGKKAVDVYCHHWFDVRAFGQVMAIKGAGKGDGAAIGIRGPVSVSMARSLDFITIDSAQITRSVNAYEEAGGKRGSDTMGIRHTVPHGAYVFRGGISTQLASLTGFTEDDAEAVKTAILHMLQDDESYARPAGSMELHRLFWWTHSCPSGTCSPAKLFRSVQLSSQEEWPFYTAEIEQTNGVSLEEYIAGALVE